MTITLVVFSATSSNLPKDFNTNGDLINGWYWLRDNSLQNYAQWTFENIPSGNNDLTLDITALATDRQNGGRGFPAEFLLIYEVPGGNVFVTQKVTLPNISLPNDSVGYTCKGQVTIPRLVIQGASVLFVRAERISLDTNHVAFKKGSIEIVEIAGEETFPPYQETQFNQGNQLPDTNNQNEAFIIQPGTYQGSLGGQIAGDQNDKGSNHDAGDSFEDSMALYPGVFNGFLNMIDKVDWYNINLSESQTISLQLFMPPEANFRLYLYRPGSSSSRAVSPTPQGNMTTLQYTADTSGIWGIRVTRSSGEGDYQLSINVSGYPSGQIEQSQSVSAERFTANKFRSNGNLIQGWYWLRDSSLQQYAEWTFENIPSGNTDLTLDITALATNQVGGGSGFPARFKLIYGFPGSGSMGGVFKTAEITLPNVSPPNDPVGYTCHALVTIPRSFIAGATTFFFRVERISPNDNHVAFNQESITLFTEEPSSGFREIGRSGTK